MRATTSALRSAAADAELAARAASAEPPSPHARRIRALAAHVAAADAARDGDKNRVELSAEDREEKKKKNTNTQSHPPTYILQKPPPDAA
jgi:hypothetical protein